MTSNFTNNHILMIYIEPTPYIIELIKMLEQQWQGSISVLFLTKNLSQPWDLSLNTEWMVLPKYNRFKFIINLLLNKKYKLVQIAGWGNLFCFISIILSKILRLPVLVETDTPLFKKIKTWKRIVKKTFYPLFFKNVTLFLAGGIKQIEYLRHYSVPNKRIVSMQMTVDTLKIKKYIEKLSDSKRQLLRNKYFSNDSLIFLFVGRLERHKGILDLITVFNQTKNITSNLLIVGNGNLSEEIKESANKNIKIHYAGRLTNSELLDAYFIADVVILPSHQEPWGLVVNEAMAASRPVIVSDEVGCIADLVCHGETGYIFKSESIRDLTRAIKYFHDHPEECQRMGKMAAEKIKNWTIENETRNICNAWLFLNTK